MAFSEETRNVLNSQIESSLNLVRTYRDRLGEDTPPDVDTRLRMAEESLEAAKGKLAQQRDLQDIMYFFGRAQNTLGYVQCWNALKNTFPQSVPVPAPQTGPTNPSPKADPTTSPSENLKPEPAASEEESTESKTEEEKEEPTTNEPEKKSKKSGKD